MKAYVIDTETTGTKEPQVIEYGQLEVFINDKCEIHHNDNVFAQKYKPNKDIEYGAMATHGITPDKVEGLDAFDLSEIRFNCDYLIGHNIEFDWEAIGSPDVKRICTLALAKEAWPTLDSHKLMAIVAYLDLAKFKKYFLSAHSVETDIKATAFVLSVLATHYKADSFNALHALSEAAMIPSIMSFGKHKGNPVRSVDNGWREWYMKQENPDKYLLKAFEKYPYGK